MRILLVGNYTHHSGYGIQLRLLTPYLLQAGHQVAVVNIGGGGGMAQDIKGVTVLPTYLDPLGSDSILQHAARFRADIVLTLIDSWGMKAEVMGKTFWVAHTPIDHTPVPPAVMESLQAAQVVFALSRFGQTQLSRVGIDALYVPHAVDPTIWQSGNKAQARAALGIPQDVFFPVFVGVNDTQPSRKGIPELLAAWQIHGRTYPDSVLYMHTSAAGNIPVAGVHNGVNIPELVKTLQLDMNTIRFADQDLYRLGYPTAQMVAIAQAADVLVLPTRGEGFGLPLIEFQRVGCPVITTDFAAGAELCFGGWLVEGENEWSWQNAWVMKPGIASIVESLEAAYMDRDNPHRKAQAIEGARQFDIETVMHHYMLPALELVAERLLEAA